MDCANKTILLSDDQCVWWQMTAVFTGEPFVGI